MNSLTGLPIMQVQSPTDIHKTGVDETKCIEGIFKMAFEREDSIDTLVGIDEHALRIVFRLHREYLDLLHDLRPRCTFRLSLRGAKRQLLKEIPKPSTLPLTLYFSDGVEIQWTQPDGSIQNLNTWEEHGHGKDDQDTWYSSPCLSKEVARPNGLRLPKRHYDEIDAGGQPNEPRNDAIHRDKLSGVEKKKRRLETKERSKAEREASLLSVTDRYQPVPEYPLRSSNEVGSVKVENDLSASQSISPKLKAGLRAGRTIYPAIQDVEMGTFTSLIGVVTNISSPDQTNKGDWMRLVQIVDPSVYDTNPAGMKINCFTKTHVEWLPTADCGDVLILRRVKIGSFRGSLVGTGYKDQLHWAAWSPPGRIHHGTPNKAPKQAGLAPGGFGVCFSPFYQPTKEEILYCVKLSDWWREVQKEEQKHLVHTSFSTSVSHGFATRRLHRLISEAGPNVPPDGYFDCTVEALQGYSGNSGVYALYVTDYTMNEQMGTVQQSWCHSSLSDKVLRIEMWDAAAEIGPTMNPGEFFFIRNARMITNHYSGYLQAKLQQNRIVRLMETDADSNPHLKALLERKKQWEENQSTKNDETEHRLIENFEEDKFLNCTVEVLRAMPDTKEGSFIYVTDYTSHPSLKSLKVNEPWTQGLIGYIVKIYLMEGQKRMAESVVPGSFYCIRKLRWKYSHVDACIRAQLGGSERLITMLNPQNEHLNDLLRRKESWEKTIRDPSPSSKRRPPQILQADDHLGLKDRDPACINIKDIPPPDTGPMQLKVFAKPVSFYPMNLDDAFYQFCARCKIEVPEKHHACFKCDDFEHGYVEIKFQIYLIIEDEEKQQILISVNDTNSIWDGLKRVRPRDDESTARLLRSRLSPLLGNLPLVHEFYSQGQTLAKRTSFFNFDIDSWVDPEKGRGYTFCKYS